jgi:hypothetical protein|tara:strand:- start:4974 stop:5144 length:171 start_codon:yes stop_codon:yes gene_type:complete
MINKPSAREGESPLSWRPHGAALAHLTIVFSGICREPLCYRLIRMNLGDLKGRSFI